MQIKQFFFTSLFCFGMPQGRFGAGYDILTAQEIDTSTPQ
jgi:hypothetical protein